MGSIGFYTQSAENLGFEKIQVIEMTEQKSKFATMIFWRFVLKTILIVWKWGWITGLSRVKKAIWLAMPLS